MVNQTELEQIEAHFFSPLNTVVFTTFFSLIIVILPKLKDQAVGRVTDRSLFLGQ